MDPNDDFGPFFLKYCSDFPFGAKVCINGYHWAGRGFTHDHRPDGAARPSPRTDPRPLPGSQRWSLSPATWTSIDNHYKTIRRDMVSPASTTSDQPQQPIAA